MLKTKAGSKDYGRGRKVSIPHRYAENLIMDIVIFADVSVSIPHRYAENRQHAQQIRGEREKFQSLIGMLKTCQAEKEWPAKLLVSIPHRYAENAFNPAP